MPAVDDGGAKGGAADRVHKSDGGTSKGDGADGESANGQAEPECESPAQI